MTDGKPENKKCYRQQMGEESGVMARDGGGWGRDDGDRKRTRGRESFRPKHPNIFKPGCHLFVTNIGPIGGSPSFRNREPLLTQENSERGRGQFQRDVRLETITSPPPYSSPRKRGEGGSSRGRGGFEFQENWEGVGSGVVEVGTVVKGRRMS